MSELTKFMLKAYLRKVLTALGTFLLTHGVLTSSEAEGFVATYLEEIVGTALIAGSAVWTFIYQRYVKNKVVAALKAPPSTKPAELEELTVKEAAKA